LCNLFFIRLFLNYRIALIKRPRIKYRLNILNMYI
jgi:hypothetical protein